MMDRLVKANKESFGDVRLDCCKVTKNINNSNTVKNNQRLS